MNLAKTILTALLCSVSCLVVYHFVCNQKQIIEIQDDLSRYIARTDGQEIRSYREAHYHDAPDDFVIPANQARRAVVSVKAIKIKGRGYKNDRYSKTNASGVIISSNGYIITNHHVVEDADNIEVTLDNKREYDCQMIGYDRSTDLALLKIEEENLDFLRWGDSDSLQIGEWVLAVGNPFKLNASVTAGIVSAKGREINIFDRQGVESFIQTDAAINPGNSGGALINTNGQLIGINTAILTYSGKYEGFSFAIPSTIVRKVVNDLREYGAVQRAWLGVGILDLDDQRAKQLGLDIVEGVYIDLVEKNGAAQKVGIRSGDVIISMENKPTLSKPDFLEVISQKSPGDLIELTILRNGKRLTKKATLQNQLNTTDLIGVRKDQILTKLGFELRELASKEKQDLNIEGVMVVSIQKNSTIGETNMEPGYVVTSINNERVKTVDQLISKLTAMDGLIRLKGIYEHYPSEYPYEFYK